MQGYSRLILPCIFACGALWALWEQDIFWQIRMGEELLNTGSVFKTGDWSFTVPGFMDINFWWLPSLLFFVTERLGGDAGLVILRALLVGVYLIFCARLLSTRSLVAGLGLAFMAASFRFQLRPDFMIGVVMAALVALWTWEGLSEKHRLIGSVVLGVLACNFHMGPQILVLLTSMALTWTTTLTNSRKWAWSFGFAALFFVTPVHFHSLPLLFKTLSLGATSEAMRNYDWDSFHSDMFVLNDWGLTGFAWLVFYAFVAIGFWRMRDGLFASRYVRALMLFLFALSFYRSRGIIFAVPLALPYFSVGWEAVSELVQTRARVLLSALVFLLYVFHLKLWPHPLSLELDRWVYPQRGVELVRTWKPAGHILHDPSLGNYMVWRLKEYPVAVDTRQYPFKEISQELARAGKNPAAMEELLQRLDIQTVFLPVPPVPLNETGLIDTMRPFFPKERWALVYFDNHYSILRKRSAENAEALARDEYHVLTPQFPPFYRGEPPAATAEVQNEIARCLKDDPENLYCGFRASVGQDESQFDAQPLLKLQRPPQFDGYLNRQIEQAYFFGKKDVAEFLQTIR